MLKTLSISLLAVGLSATASLAASVTPNFIYQGGLTNGTSPEDTGIYRADLTGLGLSKIAQITVNDSNSGTSGSAGAFSGFDLDAIFLDIDGDYTTTGDQINASSFAFAAGALRAGTAPASQTAGALNGSSSNTTVDEAFATLGVFDAEFFQAGSISLGDGGSLTANFAPDVMVGMSLYLFIGEVGDNGESINGLIEVTDEPPAVPLPASALLLGSAILGGTFVGRRRRKS